MSILNRIRKGRIAAPLRATFAGVPGVGKSTLAAHAPAPVFMCTEEGADQLDVDRLPRPDSWEEALEIARSLGTETHNYKSFVVDTLDALEPLAIQTVCQRAGKQTLADFDFGKGQLATADLWRLFLRACEGMRNRGMNIIFLAHVHVKPFADPQLGTYDRYTPKLIDRVWNLTNEWCDLVGFCQFDTAIHEKKHERSRGIVNGARVMRTVRGTGYEAKNRYSLPTTLPLDWDALNEAIKTHGTPASELAAQLDAALVGLGDPDTTRKANEYVKKNGETQQAYAEAINTVAAIAAEKAQGK